MLCAHTHISMQNNKNLTGIIYGLLDISQYTSSKFELVLLGFQLIIENISRSSSSLIAL